MPRATPLPPDERRAAIVDATMPLLASHGREVSTRQIAEAAGVAEGTIFRVFDNKDVLIDTVIAAALDPTPTCLALAAIDRAAPLPARLEQTVRILQQRLNRVFTLFHSLRVHGPGPSRADGEERRRHDRTINEAVAAVLAPDADRLGRTEDVAELVRAVTFAVTNPFFAGHDHPSPYAEPAVVVDVLLHGLLADHLHPGHPHSCPTHSDHQREPAC